MFLKRSARLLIFYFIFFPFQIDTFLSSYGSFYRRSPKRLGELTRMAAVLEEDIVKPKRVDGTRWVDHRRRALEALETNFPSVVGHLTEVSSQQRQDINKKDAVKAKGWLRKITNYKFLLHLGLYKDMLTELSRLSLLFQRDDVTVPDVVDGVLASQQVLTNLGVTDGAALRHIRGQVKIEEGNNSSKSGNSKSFKYRGVDIKDVKKAELAFGKVRKGLVQSVLTALGTRFDSFKTDKVLQAVGKLDPKNWPKTKDISGYANEEVDMLLRHFEPVLTHHGCKLEEALSEWELLKITVRKYYRNIEWNELWSRIFLTRKDQHKNILHLLEIIQVIPLATAKVERAFSLMGRVKSDWRSSLATNTLDDLMIISLEGPPEEVFDPQSSINTWYGSGKQSRRLHVQPYGKRNRDRELHELESDSELEIMELGDSEENKQNDSQAVEQNDSEKMEQDDLEEGQDASKEDDSDVEEQDSDEEEQDDSEEEEHDDSEEEEQDDSEEGEQDDSEEGEQDDSEDEQDDSEEEEQDDPEDEQDDSEEEEQNDPEVEEQNDSEAEEQDDSEEEEQDDSEEVEDQDDPEEEEQNDSEAEEQDDSEEEHDDSEKEQVDPEVEE